MDIPLDLHLETERLILRCNEIKVNEMTFSCNKQTLTNGDISLQIDTNWTNEGTLQYAGLHLAYLGLISSENFIPANSISITQYQDGAVLEYKVYDPQSQRYSVVNNMYFEVNKKMYIVSISAFKSVVENNKNYFNDLLKSVQVKQE